MQHDTDPAPEFSRIVRADTVQRDGEVVQTIEATPAERHALAERFELEAIDRLTATIRLRAVRGGQMVRVAGELEADVVQTCVVTLEPVPAHVEESFGALFAPESMVPKDEDEIEIDPNVAEEDLPEAMINGRIDIGELTAQHLSLALDPYPHAEGIEFSGYSEGEDEDEEAEAATSEKPNPFAALERLKRQN
jgi:Predicted metal-binding, possibly nucleic acid-binding protein